MTVSQLITLLAKHNIPLDTPMSTPSEWEDCQIDMDGVFYNPYFDRLEFTRGVTGDLEDYLNWVCLSLAENETSWYADDDMTEYYINPETSVVNSRRVRREPWYKFAQTLAEDFGSRMIYSENEDDEDAEDDNVVYCPECGEPIYQDDYPEIMLDGDNKYICPICWEKFDKE